ncbi:hypothetical protein LTR37_001400 [Vermiconidia calcicola]|uniref:Uncharacterized protein n=1 Tax=Vermiconidia calcicola TaxID=1690605 RepID=A0ACC3NX89_9PEZI|nr:hypothetical protein LTR37_001400 [Vermiconidia calcicola]
MTVRITRAAAKRNLALILERKLLLAERSLEELAGRIIKLPDELQLEILMHLAALPTGQEIRVREELQPKAHEVLMKTATFHLHAAFHHVNVNDHPNQYSGRLRPLAPRSINGTPTSTTDYAGIRSQLRKLYLSIEIHDVEPLAKKEVYYPRNLYDAQDHMPYLKNWLPQLKTLHVVVDTADCGLNNRIRRKQYLAREDRQYHDRFTDMLTETFRLRGRMLSMSDVEITVLVQMHDFDEVLEVTALHGKNFMKIPGQDMMDLYRTTAVDLGII